MLILRHNTNFNFQSLSYPHRTKQFHHRSLATFLDLGLSLRELGGETELDQLEQSYNLCKASFPAMFF
ncbi:MAG: hypothetical protein WCJ49_07685, partial [Deltaproteobacteria bacterium]